MSVCDSLGVVHPVELYFVKVGDDLWEYVTLDDLFSVARIHALTAFDYLSAAR